MVAESSSGSRARTGADPELDGLRTPRAATTPRSASHAPRWGPGARECATHDSATRRRPRSGGPDRPRDSRADAAPASRRRRPARPPSRGRAHPGAAPDARHGPAHRRVRARARRDDRPRRHAPAPTPRRTGPRSGSGSRAATRTTPPARSCPTSTPRGCCRCSSPWSLLPWDVAWFVWRGAHDPAAPVVDPLGVHAAARCATAILVGDPRVPDGGEPRHREHQPAARADGVRGALHGRSAGRASCGASRPG